MNKQCLPILLIILACITSGLNASAEIGVSDKEILIGTSNDQSSPSGVRGQMLNAGMKAYFDQVNSKGGVYGRKINFITKDDQFDAEKTIENFNQLLKQGIFCGAGFIGSPNAAKLVPMATTNKVPVFGIISGAEFIYKPVKHYVFNFRASYDDEVKSLVDSLWKQLGFRRIAVAYEEDAFGSAGLHGANAALQSYGVAPCSVVSFPKAGLDADKVVSQLRASNPDAVLISAIAGPCKDIFKHAESIGWHPLFMTITIDPGVYQCNNLVVAQVVPLISQKELPTVQLYEKLVSKTPGARSGQVGLEGFVQAMLVVEGLKRCGPQLTREGFISALETIRDFDLGLGADIKATLSPTYHGAVHKVYHSVIENGAPVPISSWKRFAKAKLTDRGNKP